MPPGKRLPGFALAHRCEARGDAGPPPSGLGVDDDAGLKTGVPGRIGGDGVSRALFEILKRRNVLRRSPKPYNYPMLFFASPSPGFFW
jgi:hypothetical protein